MHKSSEKSPPTMKYSEGANCSAGFIRLAVSLRSDRTIRITETQGHELSRALHDMPNSGVCDKQEWPCFCLDRKKGYSVKTERLSRNGCEGFAYLKSLHKRYEWALPSKRMCVQVASSKKGQKKRGRKRGCRKGVEFLLAPGYLPTPSRTP